MARGRQSDGSGQRPVPQGVVEGGAGEFGTRTSNAIRHRDAQRTRSSRHPGRERRSRPLAANGSRSISSCPGVSVRRLCFGCVFLAVA